MSEHPAMTEGPRDLNAVRLDIEDSVNQCESDVALLGTAIDEVFDTRGEKDGGFYVYRLNAQQVRSIQRASVHMWTSVRALSEAFYGEDKTDCI